MTLRVVDLFCGGGGLSEGFRQAGAEVILGVDYDKAAVTTFEKNHKGSTTIQADLASFDVTTLPQCDVLIGGPPCVEFSYSKIGRSDPLAGLLLVQTFLRAVHHLKPRYWVMENVPRISKFLGTEIPLAWVGVDRKGYLEVPTKVELNSADYGVPQTRKRFLMGNFPVPPKTHADQSDTPLLRSADTKPWRTIRDVMANIPSPLARPNSLNSRVSDPNYELELNLGDFTEHFYDTRIPPDECDRIWRAKTQHPFYGNLDFPDRVDRPARTVVATQLGRETLILGETRGVKAGAIIPH